MDTLNLGAVTSISNSTDFNTNLKKTDFFLEKAKKQNCSMVVFPEMNLTGYTTGGDLEKSSLEIDENLKSLLINLYNKHKIPYLCGLAEKEGDKIYATHLYINRSKIIGRYRKIQPGPPEINKITPGDEISIFEIDDWKFGIQLCFDSHFPELSTFMALKGADIIIIPHASPRGSSKDKLNSWARHLSARAYDNGTYLMAVNQCGKNNRNLFFPGVAVLFSPSGNISKSYLTQNEELFIFKLEKIEINDVKTHRMKNFLNYRRHQFYKNLFK